MFSSPKTLIFTFPRPRRIGLHMFFVFYPIDVYFLDVDKRVIEIKKDFRPFTFYTSKNKAHYVVEIPRPNKVKLKKGTLVRF